MPTALFEELSGIAYLQDYSFEPEYAAGSRNLEGFALTPLDPTLRKARNLLKLLPEDLGGMRVLDIGCNKGFFCFEALRRGAARVVGIDVLDEIVRLLERIVDSSPHFKNLVFHCMPFDHKVLPLGPFDIILFCSSYHYVYAQLKSHLKIFELLARLRPVRVVLDLPLEVDDEFAQKVLRERCEGEEYLAYNGHAILHAASQHFGMVRYIANSGFLPTRDIFVLERPGETESYDCVWEQERAPWSRIRSALLERS